MANTNVIADKASHKEIQPQFREIDRTRPVERLTLKEDEYKQENT